MDIQQLEPRIRTILTKPGVDFNTISAKRIRKQLQAEDPAVKPEWVRANKVDIDALIATIFERLRASKLAEQQEGDPLEDPPAKPDPEPAPAPAEPSPDPEEPTFQLALPKPAPPQTPIHALKRKRDASPPASSPAFPLAAAAAALNNKPSVTVKSAASDAAYARQLSAEINGHSTRSGPSRKSSVRGKKVKKSKAEVEDSDGAEDGEPASKKKKSGGGGGFQKPYALSPALQNLLGETQMARPAIVKALWIHIKGSNLQNPLNKKEILCDEPMKAVFGVSKIDMFKMNKELGRHLSDL